MSKDFTEVDFDLDQFEQELDRFGKLLNSKKILGEREIQEFFKASPQLTASIGMTVGKIGMAKLVAYEFEIMGDYRADIVFGHLDKQFCFVELENGAPDSVFEKVGQKSTKEWSRRLEHGFSQQVDWFCHLDDFKKTARFCRNFGGEHIDFMGLLLIGRNEGLTADDRWRLRWRAHHVIVNSHHMYCMTYDDLYIELAEAHSRYATLFKSKTPVAPPPPAPASAPAPTPDSATTPKGETPKEPPPA